MKRLTRKEFVEQGILQEINRRLLHPVGLAMRLQALNPEASPGQVRDFTIDIEDIREDDEEGFVFAPPDADKSARFSELEKARHDPRQR